MDATETTDIEVKNNENDEQSDKNDEQQTEEKDGIAVVEEESNDDRQDESGEIYDTIESPKESEGAVVEDVPKDDPPTSPIGIQAGTEDAHLEVKNPDKENDKVLTVELPVEKTDRSPPEIVIEPKFSDRHPRGKSPSQPVRVVTPKYPRPPANKKQLLRPPKPPDRKCSCEKFRFCLQLAIFSAFVFGYAIGGAYLFSHLEKTREIEYNAKIDKWKNDTAILLATELRQVTPYEGTWARKVFQHLEIFEKDLLRASAIGYRRYDHADRGQRWTWTSSLYFSVSLMTTSGYGPMTPRSEMGRTAAVLYSLFGVPLAFSWLMVVGYILATSWASFFQNLCCHEKIAENIGNSPTNHNISIKQPKLRKNSVVPIEEQRLIYRTNSQLRHPKNVCTTKYPPKSPNNYSVGCNNLAKPPTRDAPNSSGTMCRTEIEMDQIREVFHTLDYTTAVVYAMVMFVIYFMFFSILFSLLEGWILTDVLYFSFLIFMTLGPGCHEMQDDGSEIKIKNNIFYTVHLCTGYCILSMIVNLIYMLIQNRRGRIKVNRCEPFDSFYQEKY